MRRCATSSRAPIAGSRRRRSACRSSGSARSTTRCAANSMPAARHGVVVRDQPIDGPAAQARCCGATGCEGADAAGHDRLFPRRRLRPRRPRQPRRHLRRAVRRHRLRRRVASTIAWRPSICIRRPSRIACAAFDWASAHQHASHRAVRRERRRQPAAAVAHARRRHVGAPSGSGADLSQPRRRHDHCARTSSMPMRRCSARAMSCSIATCGSVRGGYRRRSDASRRSRDSDFAGLPPTVIVTAQCDPLSSDGEAYRDRIVAAGGRAAWREEAGPRPQLPARPALDRGAPPRPSTASSRPWPRWAKATGRTEARPTCNNNANEGSVQRTRHVRQGGNHDQDDADRQIPASAGRGGRA